jgi:ElaB/YqjD/DUF883 family membrane-anchored ribosome-binding protein
MADTRKSDVETSELAKLTEPLAAEVAAIRADLAKLASSAASSGRKHASALRAAAVETASDGYAKGEATLESVLAEMKSLEEDLADATRRKPFAALGLAALVGFLLGVLFRR